ncbi:MAG: RluA family pseudouridine synthase [Caldilineaceae bacterium]|nr:RluA family pseudouridine synthase [Caldilineaceae bacterium]
MTQPTRLDRVLRDRFPEWGRQAVQQLISAKQVRVNGQPVWLASWQVHNGDRLEILQPPAAKPQPATQFAEAWLITQEAAFIVVNKPAGLLAESPTRREAANLLDLAKARFGPLILFHRLDRDTSGVILLTRPGPINQYLAHAFQASLVQKEYLAVVAKPNQLAATGVIDARLDTHPTRRDQMVVVTRGGKTARTRYAVVAEDPARQLVRLWPETGRTHQLRVHLAHLGAPILGDRLYGKLTSAERLLLHAHQLTLPAHADYPLRHYTAPLPASFWPNE